MELNVFEFLLGGNLEGKIHLVNWEVVCTDKDKGGLGLRKLAMLNKALLGKWIWRYACDKDNLWKQVITVKYGQEGLGWRPKKANGAVGVGVWEEIWKESDWCWDNMIFRAGKGTKIRFWTDVWCTDTMLSHCFPYLFVMSVQRSSTVEEMWDQNSGQGGWNLNFLRDFNDWELDMVGDLLHVLRGHRPSLEEDSVIWRQGRNGQFRVKEAYSLLTNPNDTSFPSRCIWVARVPTKVAFFAWEATWGKVLTLDRLQRRGVQLLNCCFLCGCEEENVNHILIHYIVVRALWDIVLGLVDVKWVFPETVKEVLISWRGPFVGKKRKKVWEFIPLCIFWTVWKERNRLAFRGGVLNIQKLKNFFVCNLWSWAKLYLGPYTFACPFLSFVSTLKLPNDSCLQVLVESYDRFLEFVQRSKVVSPIFALETATALQRIEVAAKPLPYHNVAKCGQSTPPGYDKRSIGTTFSSKADLKFALDIDLDAPKIRVPIRTCGSSRCDSHFLLDFGHFTLHTKETESDEQRQSLYSRFYISGRDIAAFFTDCGSDCQNCTLVAPAYNSRPTISPALKDSDDFCSLVDRCGMAVIVDQIKVPHPSYPSTRVSVQVPNLGIHFSPARYYRLMELLDILYGTMEKSNKSTVENYQAGLAPWSLADLATDARILVWRGIGNSVAAWQPCFLVLSNLYLYILESETSQSYMRCSSMAGKQVTEVPSSNLGGSLFCIAVSFRGMDFQKALESSSTLVIEFRDEEEKTTWLRGLTQATYRASAPALVDVLGESSDGVTEFGDPRASNLKKADLVINGALLETKLLIYGKAEYEGHGKLEEILILEILAGGGKKVERVETFLRLQGKAMKWDKEDRMERRIANQEANILAKKGMSYFVKRFSSPDLSSLYSSRIQMLSEVHVVCWEGDLTVKMKLHSLKIKDELQGRLSTSLQYLACSVHENDHLFASPRNLDPSVKELSTAQPEEDDIFKDALQDFMSLPDQESNLQHMVMPKSAWMEDVTDFAEVDSAVALIHEMDLGKGKGTSSETFFEAQDSDHSDFVSVTFLTRNPGSPDYDGVDTQMSICMSKLEFFCNRPTIVALIDFGLDLSSRNSGGSSTNATKVSDDESSLNKDKTEESECVFVKGLLGYGKSRVIFYLNMNMDSVTVFLNKEDGSQLAMLVQESFLLDLKVQPTSLSIDGTLGNFRLRDMAFEIDHSWGWLCDIRNPGVESLIKFTFNSYSVEDDDYKGYDYSLCGRLSAVRIVFLYRFVQEVTAYFMGLATPHTEEVIKLVDKVGDLEWLIQKYEIDGASAIKLDLSLDTPIIIVPRNSMSKEFVFLPPVLCMMLNWFT
ncbi:putative ribonuclease H protein [Vitis vinifera]|uniref:Putative ribonuclease H protein n=1 Tax=Vitis vinifera TaxID=29760 RepID=A0A438KKX5_VITVI|nr:putative ribonuclease H protein [Vitis vinifera]